MATTIRLEKDIWEFDELDRLGPPGGFGEVFRGRGRGGEVAIKRLKMTAGAAAHREMSIGMVLANRTLEHVVPVLDFGQDAETDRYYLVMPICDHSLHDAIRKVGRLDWNEARAAALDIIAGLQEVGDIVHRDLKPGNVLWLEGRWLIADFGIAKFVEDSTSLETLRRSLTPPFAAPEQWLGERPTKATDVYALGCILHAMLNGRPPFVGDVETIRQGHLNDQPPPIAGADTRLQGLVQFMLRKIPVSRPSLDRCASVISGIAQGSPRPANQALAEAGAFVAKAQAEQESAQRATDAAHRERAALANEAIADLNAMFGRLFDEIEASSEATERWGNAITLGPAHLLFSLPMPGESDQQPESAYQHGWDVAAFSIVNLRATLERHSSYEPPVYVFPATLVYARTREDPDFRWREMSFFNWAQGQSMAEQPVALDPRERDFHLAISVVVSGWQLAHGPLPIDGEDEEAFRDRWLTLFAKAAQGKLRPSSSMPLPDGFFK